MQSFIGKVNFLRRFIPSFSKILMNITNILKKDHEIKWTPDTRTAFRDIKNALIEAPVLVIPDLSKDFLIFSYGSYHTIARVLLQKNNQNVR